MKHSRQNKSTARVRTPKSPALRLAMLAKNVNAAQLAEKAGLSLGTVRNVMAENNKAQSARAKIELALGQAIWNASPGQSQRDQ